LIDALIRRFIAEIIISFSEAIGRKEERFCGHLDRSEFVTARVVIWLARDAFRIVKRPPAATRLSCLSSDRGPCELNAQGFPCREAPLRPSRAPVRRPERSVPFTASDVDFVLQLLRESLETLDALVRHY
jgi:hypothetical protein